MYKDWTFYWVRWDAYDPDGWPEEWSGPFTSYDEAIAEAKALIEEQPKARDFDVLECFVKNVDRLERE